MNTRLAARRIALVAVVLSPCATAAEPLRLDFADHRPGGARVYSSDSATPWGTLQVVDGGTATLQVESGRHYEVRATGWRWSQVQEVPANVDAVQVTPRVEGEQVTLQVMVFQQKQDRRHSYSTTTAGRRGEWLQVLGPGEQPGAKVYGTKAGVGQAPVLYIRVSADAGNP